MSESNNVRFIEDNGKWAWKRYDADGSVIYRSPLFDTEREAREDYDLNGTPNESSVPQPESTPTENTQPDSAPENSIAPESTEPVNQTEPSSELPTDQPA